MDAWTRLGEGVHVRQSRAYRMNSGVLIADGHAVLVDPGVLPSDLDDLAAFVRDAADAVTVILTHDHWDHVLGPAWWPDAEYVGHDLLAPALSRDRDAIAAAAVQCAREHGETWTRGFQPFAPQRAVSGQHFSTVGGFRMVFRDAPGHAASQLSVHLPEHRLLFAADMLSDIEIPILDGPAEPYRRTLAALAPLVEGGAIETLVPGHGTIARGNAVGERLRRDIDYLESLDAGMRECRGQGLSLEATQARLAPLHDANAFDASMVPVHRDNVRFVYEAAAAPRQARAARRAAR